MTAKGTAIHTTEKIIGMYTLLYVCMHVCMYVCMYVCGITSSVFPVLKVGVAQPSPL